MPPKKNLTPQYIELPFVPPKDSTPKHKEVLYSNFLLTLNTNIRVEPEKLDESVKMLYAMGRNLMFEEGGVERFVKMGEKPADVDRKNKHVFRENSALKYEDVMMEAPKIKSRVEIGQNARGKRLHMHFYIGMVHKKYMQLNRDKILQYANDFLRKEKSDLRIYHIDIKGTPLTLEEYVMWDLEWHPKKTAEVEAPQKAPPDVSEPPGAIMYSI